MALTDLAIKHAKPKNRPYTVTDGGGLGIEISPAGGKAWRWRFRFGGKHQTLTIGKYPAVSISQARRARNEAREQLNAGYHPHRVKQAQKLRRMAENETTFESVARKWHEARGDRLNSKYHVQVLSRMEQYVFPIIGNFPIKDITIPDVVKVIEKIGSRGIIATAKRMKQYISQVFRYAAYRGLCDHNPAADLRDLLPAAVEAHHPCIPMGEAPELLQKIEERNEDLSKFAMKLIALPFFPCATFSIVAPFAENIIFNLDYKYRVIAFTTIEPASTNAVTKSAAGIILSIYSKYNPRISNKAFIKIRLPKFLTIFPMRFIGDFTDYTEELVKGFFNHPSFKNINRRWGNAAPSTLPFLD